ncbi:MAG: hypothetical protein WBN68_07090 [Sedimenticolaceae bacterium]
MKSGDEFELNAYLDGELSDDEQAELLEIMRTDEEFARRVCALGRLKAQVHLAYADPPEPAQRKRRQEGRPWSAAAAGIALVAVGLVSGWLLHANAPPGSAEAQRFIILDPAGRGQAPAVDDDGEMRIVFHLTDASQTVAGELLDEVEGLLIAYQADQRPLRVEVVSHSDGLGLLRQRLSGHQPRIHELATRFSNLTFVACQNTIDRLRVEQGIEVRLVPDAEVIDSGVNHVVKRQKQGWSYIRV